MASEDRQGDPCASSHEQPEPAWKEKKDGGLELDSRDGSRGPDEAWIPEASGYVPLGDDNCDEGSISSGSPGAGARARDYSAARGAGLGAGPPMSLHIDPEDRMPQ
ncbi:hypothetical protein EV182_002339, partial [Spiromyces aspiralis]